MKIAPRREFLLCGVRVLVIAITRLKKRYEQARLVDGAKK